MLKENVPSRSQQLRWVLQCTEFCKRMHMWPLRHSQAAQGNFQVGNINPPERWVMGQCREPVMTYAGSGSHISRARGSEHHQMGPSGPRTVVNLLSWLEMTLQSKKTVILTLISSVS